MEITSSWDIRFLVLLIHPQHLLLLCSLFDAIVTCVDVVPNFLATQEQSVDDAGAIQINQVIETGKSFCHRVIAASGLLTFVPQSSKSIMAQLSSCYSLGNNENIMSNEEQICIVINLLSAAAAHRKWKKFPKIQRHRFPHWRGGSNLSSVGKFHRN